MTELALSVVENLDKAKALVKEANLAQAKEIISEAEALRIYAEQSSKGLEIQNHCAELRIRAERRAGELIRKMPRATPQTARIMSNVGHDSAYGEALKNIKITRQDANRWQLEATIPEETFEQFIAETKAKSEELTSKGALTLATRIKRQQGIKKAPPFPDGKYQVIYADPPWKYNNAISSWGPASLHYDCLPLDDIIGLRDGQGTLVTDVFADNSVLFMWVTNPFLRDAFRIIDAWGFEYKTNIVWVKTDLRRPGSGFYVRGRHELLFICTRGSFLPEQAGKEPIGSVIEAPARAHSEKPGEAYEIIERMYPNSKYLELFARSERKNWVSWGNETQNGTETQ